MRYGIVVAAGSGQRMGFVKQFMDLAGRPMWVRSVEALLQSGIHQVIVVCQRSHQQQMQESVSFATWASRATFCEGGSTRFESVRAGMMKVFSLSEVKNTDIVAIHDAARPFVSHADVEAVCAAAEESGAALLGEMCRDTVKHVEAGSVLKTVNRELLFLAQTPQVMQISLAEKVYTHRGNSPVTDDMELLEQQGVTVKAIHVSEFNGKVTTPTDLRFASWLAMEKWGNSLCE
jgi:2-C-methyl-D-erythritol 4-phosphate cytidylyltransferase